MKSDIGRPSLMEIFAVDGEEILLYNLTSPIYFYFSYLIFAHTDRHTQSESQLYLIVSVNNPNMYNNIYKL